MALTRLSILKQADFFSHLQLNLEYCLTIGNYFLKMQTHSSSDYRLPWLSSLIAFSSSSKRGVPWRPPSLVTCHLGLSLFRSCLGYHTVVISSLEPPCYVLFHSVLWALGRGVSCRRIIWGRALHRELFSVSGPWHVAVVSLCCNRKVLWGGRELHWPAGMRMSTENEVED